MRNLQNNTGLELESVVTALRGGGWREIRRFQFEKSGRPGALSGARGLGWVGVEISAQRGEAKALCLDKLSPGQGAGMEAGEKFADFRRAAVAAAG